jgi:CHAT domain-containing protein/tetratricopeptide (TPR) repeat protein
MLLSLLAFTLAPLDSASPSHQNELEEISSRIQAGSYAEAEERAWRLYASARFLPEPASLAAASAADLIGHSLRLQGRSGTPAGRSAMLDGIRLKRQILGPQSVETSRSLSTLAALYAETDEVDRALPLLTEAVAIVDASTAPPRTELADLLDALGESLTKAARYDEASAALDRSMTLRRQDGQVRGIAHTAERQALLAQALGRYEEQRKFLEQARTLRESLPPDADLAANYRAFTDLLWFEGDLTGARDINREALRLAESVLGPRHPTVAEYMESLAFYEEQLGALEEGLRLRQAELAIIRATLEPDHPSLAWALNGLGIPLLDRGEYSEAAAYFTRALELMERRLGSQHEHCATFAHNLALAHGYMGDVKTARRLQDRAISTWEKTRGPDHPYLAIALDALGEALSRSSQDADAVPLFERALAIRQRSLRPGHRETAYTLNNLAASHRRLGHHRKALELSARAVEFWRRIPAFSSQHNFAVAVAERASIAAESGRWAEALRYSTEAIDLWTRIYGRDHPSLSGVHTTRAIALAGRGRRRDAITAAVRSENIGREHLRLVIRSLSERQALRYASIRPAGRDLAISLLVQTTQAGSRKRSNATTASVLDAIVLSRSLVLDEMASRQRLVAAGDDDGVATLAAALRAARQRLANLVIAGARQTEPARYAQLLNDAQEARNQAEQELAAKSVLFRDELRRSNVGIEAARKALPPDSALVSFVRYEQPSPREGAYAAFVTPPTGAITVVPLGSTSAIDSLVAHWRKEAVLSSAGALDSFDAAERRSRVAGEILRRRVWDPLVPAITNARRVFIVPEGSLASVSFAALPTGREAYLLEAERVLHYLSAERDLVVPASQGVGQGLLAVGGPAFDDWAAATDSMPGALRGRTGCRPKAAAFVALPAALQEATRVADLWPGEATVLTGSRATEKNFKSMAPGRRVLHLATHGFTTSPECAADEHEREVLSDNPLLGSALALAGANWRGEIGVDQDDGFLTAEEVAALNLHGVEWAVLSACDTGLGPTNSREGILGLRRAFQVAGAGTVIMSLWPVEDASTASWMRRLYEARFSQHKDTASAVRDASIGLLRERRDRRESTHPAFWAGFVAAGDWR